MHEPARVLLDMDAGELDLPLLPIVAFDLDVAAKSQGLVVLRDLVGLVEVGVEVVLCANSDSSAIGQLTDFATFMAYSITRLLRTGMVPGSPRQTGQT